MISITAVNGSGTATRDFGNLQCESVSLISPDNTPMYDFAIYDANGFFVVGAVGITSQKTKINEAFRLTGVCSIEISGAVDDGVYQVGIFSK